MIGQLPSAPRRSASAPGQEAGAGTPPRERDAAARLRLEAENSALQSRLHDALEVLEGVLSERSALVKQAHELQEQLAAALQLQHSGGAGARGAAALNGTPPREAGEAAAAAGATPARVLRQELLLAQAQLGELRQAQRVWEAERAALLADVEEERARLQEGLAQALTQATSAQRDADVAAERAAHWCSLADLLQRSALLPDGPASPEGSGAGSLSATPASTAAKSSRAASCRKPSALCRMRGADAASSAARLLAEWRSPVPAAHQRCGSAGSGSPQGPGRLLTAFQAVAGEQVPPSPEAVYSAAAAAEGAGPRAQPLRSADLGPRSSKLPLKQPGPPPGSDSSAGHSPLTPLPHAVAPGAAVATPGTGSTWAGTPSAAPAGRKLPERRGLLGRLASLTACGGGLAAERIH